MRLEGSRLFERVALGQATEGREDREPVLLFNLRLQMEELEADAPVTPPLAAAASTAKQGGRS